jgi:filamentous hemagglutinin family protein
MNRSFQSNCKVQTSGRATASASANESFVMTALAFALMMSFATNVTALPTGGVTSAGVASISSDAGSTTITQSTQNAAINWQSFSIGQSEAVHFVQPNSSSVALNRVLGADPSNLLGSLSANGKVFLVNPNGILFGKSAQVNVGGLVASTLNISDADFMAGNYKFYGAGSGAVLNQGSITTHVDASYVVMLGANVSNDGTIVARLGSVALAAGTAVTLDVAGDGLLNVTVDQGAVNALIQNSGLIQADGGLVLMTAQAAGNLLTSAINNSGVIQAQTMVNHNGTIKLLGDMQRGNVNVGGTLDASAPNSGNGGFIETSAAHVQIANDAKITTLAATGLTGTWLIDPVDFTIAAIGGDITGALLGSNLLLSSVIISSSSGVNGVNGDIIVNDPVSWAMGTTLTLNAVHDVIVNAPITAVAATSTISLNALNDVRVNAVLTGTAATTVIDLNAGRDVITTAMVNTVAAGSTIRMHAGRDLSLGGSITGTAAATVVDLSAAQDVIVNAAITAVAGGSTIRMIAGRDVTITNTAPLLGVAAGTVIDLTAGRDVNVNSAIAVGAAGSTISMNAGNNLKVISAIAAGAAGSSVLLSAGQNVNITGAVSAGASILMSAGMNGNGPGVAGGTVSIVGAVTGLSTTIRFNPVSYASTSSEITAYVANATGAVDARAWVFAGGNNKTYDGTVAATLAFKGTPTTGGAVTLVPGTTTFVSKDAGTGKAVTFSGVTISGVDVGKFALFAGAGTTIANITQRALNVTAIGSNKIYDGITTDAVTLADNRIAGDVLTLSNTGANFSDKNAGIGKAVNVSGISVTGTDANNYSFNTTATTTANITPAALTVTASNVSKNYGETPILSAFTPVGLKNGETIGSVTETSPGSAANGSVAGSPYAITPSAASGGSFTASNYSITYINGVLTVKPIPLLVTAANATKIYGQTPVLTAFTVAGLVNGETVGAFTETSPGTAAAATVTDSPYAITLGNASGGSFTASNYTMTYVKGALTVAPLIQPLLVGLTPIIALALDNAAIPAIEPGETPDELLNPLPVEAPLIVPALTSPKI